MTTNLRRTIHSVAALLAAIAALPAAAQVTGSAPDISIDTGASGTTSFSLAVTDAGRIDGINGEITYDGALLGNPVVAVAPGQPAGYVAEGNELADGVYRFVLYQNPPGDPLDTSVPVMTFSFDAEPGLIGPPQIATVDFTVMNPLPDPLNPLLNMPAAARIVPGPPDTVISVGIGGGQAVTFESFDITVNRIQAPTILAGPVSQAVNAGKAVSFGVQASGLGTIGYQWFFGADPIPDETDSVYTLASAWPANAGSYSAEATNEAGTTPSGAATLAVFDPPAAYSAIHVGNTIPTQMDPLRLYPFTATMRNDSQLTWSSTQGIALSVRTDPAGFFPDNASFGIAPALHVVAAGGGEYTFSGDIVAPGVPGMYAIELQMTDEQFGAFGDIVTVMISVGDNELDFADPADRTGWFGGVVSGGDSVAASDTSGLCMTTALTGENILGWVSPERFVGYIDGAVFRIRATASTDQTAVAAIPRWEIIYDNFNSSGFGNNFAGEGMWLDQADGANGIGRPNGRTSYEYWATPNAGGTDQFRAQLNPFTDQFDDIRIILRILDLDSAPLLAHEDSGTVCIRTLRLDAFLAANASATTVWSPPLDPSTHFAQSLPQEAEGAGTAQFDTDADLIRYALTANGSGSRKTPGPYDQSLDPTMTFPFASLFPVVWNGDTLYRGILTIAADVMGESLDPVDTIFVNLDTATTEMVAIHVSSRGSPPDNFFLAASPKPGTPQQYVGYMYGHNQTDLPLDLFPGANRLRVLGDFINLDTVAGASSGLDAFALSGMELQTVTFPGM